MLADDDDRAKLIDPAILAERRAKRAEIAEDQLRAQLAEAQREGDRLQGRADALSGELELARERRDELAQRIDALERDLRVAHQREHAERQLRVETQDDLAQARRAAAAAADELRSKLRDAHQRADEIERELGHSRRDVDHAQGLIERHAAARARAEVAAAEHEARLTPVQDELEALRDSAADEIAQLEAELERRVAVQSAFASQVTALRDDVEELRERHETDAARQAGAQAALRDVIEAAARMRVRVDDAQLRRAEAQERLAQAREQLDERDEQVARGRRDLQDATVQVASLRAQLHSERERSASTLEAADAGLRAQLADQAAAFEATLQSMRAQLQAAFEVQPGAPIGPSPREAELRATVARLGGEVERLRAQTEAQAARERELATRVGELVATARDVRAGYDRELEQVEARIAAERDLHHAGRARLEARLVAHADAQDEAAAALRSVGAQLSELAEPGPAPAAAEAVIADLARAAQRLRAAAQPRVTDPVAADPVAPDAWAPPPVGPDPVTPPRARPDVSAPDDTPRPEPAPAVDPPAASPAAPHWAPFVAPPRADGRIAPWLTPALAALAGRDRAAAAEILVALLALQGRTGRSVLYDMTVPGAGMWRVAVYGGVADIVPDARRAFDGTAAFHVTGAVDDLAVLAGGGRTRLGSGARIGGSRRRARRLLRANREPVALADAATLLDPGQALALLAVAMGPDGAGDQALSVALTTPAGETWHAAIDAGAMRTGAGAGTHGAEAVLHGSPAQLVALLGGASPQGVSVVGDQHVAHEMMDLLTAIQRA